MSSSTSTSNVAATSSRVRKPRMIMEVVIPTRTKRPAPITSKRADNADSDDDDADYTPVKRVRIARKHSEVPSSDDESEYEAPKTNRQSNTPRKSALRSARPRRVSALSTASRATDSPVAGPSGTRRSATPAAEDFRAGNGQGMASLNAAIDFLDDPQGILAIADNDLETVDACLSTAGEPLMDESKPAVAAEEEYYAVDTSKLTPSPEPEADADGEDGMECGICYESIREICKRNEQEGKGGIGGSLAVVACDQQACGAIFCLHCIIEVANNKIGMYKPVTCPICTRPTDMAALRAQATAFDPARATDPIRQPVAPPPPPPPLATPQLRDQYITDVCIFHREFRPHRQYFILAQEEYIEWVADNNPTAAVHAVGPGSLRWLAQSAWEAFWTAHQKRPWRGLPRLRANSVEMRRIETLDIEMPLPVPPPMLGAAPAPAPMEALVARHRGRAARQFPPFVNNDQVEPGAGRNARGAGHQDRLERQIDEWIRDRHRHNPPMPEAPLAMAADNNTLALAALQAIHQPVPPPPGMQRLDRPGLGVPHAHPDGARVTVFDHLLTDHQSPIEGRRCMLRVFFGLRTNAEADVIIHTMRVAFGLQAQDPANPLAPAELGRMETLRAFWGQMNQARQGFLAAQGHQLPVAGYVPAVAQPVVEQVVQPPGPEAGRDGAGGEN